MSLLISNEIMAVLKTELMNAESSVQLISAFFKKNILSELDGFIPDSVQSKKILVRFRVDDLCKGASDFSLLDYALKNGWDIYIRFDLHAKTYVVDNKRGIITSANATARGLSANIVGNMEIGTLVQLEDIDITKINNLFDGAIKVTDEIYEKLSSQWNTIEISKNQNITSWSDDIIALYNPVHKTLFSHELPNISSWSEVKYVEFLELYSSSNINEIKEAFRWSNAYLWLLSILRKNNGCVFFGELSVLLHNSLVNDPKPYRRDVKEMLGNLLSLISEIDMDEIIIDRPKHSQRIRLRDL